MELSRDPRLVLHSGLSFEKGAAGDSVCVLLPLEHKTTTPYLPAMVNVVRIVCS